MESGVLMLPSVPEDDRLLDDFEAFVVVEKGLAEQTGRTYRSRAEAFVEAVGGVGVLGTLSGSEVVGFAARYVETHCWETCRGMFTATRAFLRWAHANGLTGQLAGVVPAVARPRQRAKNRGVPQSWVDRLLAAKTGPGRAERDAAVVSLIARLGLRAIEVARLELSHIDWSAGTITVRGKGGNVDKMPLPRDVGEALVDYLLVREACVCSAVFLAVNKPGRALTSAGVRHIVRDTCVVADLEPFGPHRLRHALASMLLSQGHGLEQIGLVLRHQSLASTAVYAKADMAGLTTVCRPWPTGGVA